MACLLLAITMIGLPGCRTLESPVDLASALASSDAATTASVSSTASETPTSSVSVSPVEEPVVPPELAEDAWVVALPQADAGADFPYRWQHAGLDRLLALPARERPDFAQFLTSDDAVVVSNAMILLARACDETVDRCLVEAVRNPDLKLPMRRAAAEALSLLDTPVAGPALGELLDDFKDSSDDKQLAPLHAEILRGLARHTDPTETAYFAAALKSPDGEIREAALFAYTINTAGPLPAEAVALRSDTDPRVRAAALTALVARRHPQALEFARAGLTDFHLDVRLAAIQALGRLGGDEARTMLERLLVHDPEAVRSAAVAALAAAGDDVTVFASAKDPSWQVRRSVARTLVRFPTPRGATVARQLLADGSAEVRRAVVASLDGWPLADAGPILLTVMADSPLPTRKQAAVQLAARWSPAAHFDVDAPADARKLEIIDLQSVWHSTQPESALSPIDVSPPAAENVGNPADEAYRGETSTALVAHHELLAATDPPSAATPAPAADEAASTSDSVAAAFRALSSEDPAERRAAARQIADCAAEHALDAADTEMLCEWGMAETDAGVWCELLRAVRSDKSEAAVKMACVGANHAAADVRRLSCGSLGAHSDPRCSAVLVRALADPNRTVVRAAVEALGRPGAVAESAPVERLLASDDKLLRVAAARTLAINRFASGPAALEAMSRDTDVEVRRQVAAVMGSLRDTTYLGTLVAMLDDDLGVRLASVASLSQIVGRDVNLGDGAMPPPLADQVQGWKRWWEAEGSRTAERHPPDGASTK